MSNNKKTRESILSYTHELKLSGIRKYFDEITDEAITKKIPYEQYLNSLFEKEYDVRLVNRKKRRMRTANFPFKKYLEELVLEELPKDANEKLNVLKTLKFIEDGHNLILAGNPGTGKTHIAIGLGIKACLEGKSVLFTTIPTLITKLKESQSERTLRLYENRFEKYDLIICDEMGYISFDKKGAELLFTHLSLRAGRKSTIITTNLSFDRWGELFGDPVLTAAMVDRLTHKAYMVNMNGNSYRIKETKKWNEKNFQNLKVE
jgi:DNA replication protein DnaC